ncbi:MAG: protein kinase domain-containing protein [Halothece sp.]
MKDAAYCFNPYCLHPENPKQQEKCQNCGFPMTLANQYQARKLIATGRFGRTFFGKDIVQSRFCVIKQFFPKSEEGIFLNSRKAKQLFHSEAKRLQELGHHSQIPQLYAHIEQDSYHYIIQEWIDGENLATALSHQGTFSERDIRKLLKSLLPVLQYLQEAKVIHRDIKPENIIRRQIAEKENSELVLVDFGAAKLASLSETGQTGTIIGSPGYAAPEQVYGKPTFASDIYSLGVTCLHLLTGVSPFDLYTPLENKLLWRDYLQHSPISDSLAAILDGMTAFDLKQRYSSSQEVLSALGVLSPLLQISKKNIKPETNSVIKLFSGKGAIYSLDFSGDGNFLASGGGAEWGKFIGKDNCVRLWRVGNWQTHSKLTQHAAPITAVKFTPDGKFLVSGSRDKTIKIWNLQTQQLQKTLKGHRFEINTLQVSSDGDVILSGSAGGEIILWNLQTGRVLNRLTLEQGAVYSLAISPDGESFAVGSGDMKVQVWQLHTFKPLFSLTGHTDIVSSLDFSPDGQYLASGSGDWDCTIKLWDLATQKRLQTIRGHEWAVNSIKFSPDGQYLASGSSDQTVRLVSLFQEKPLHFCGNRHQASVNSVVFSPNGQWLASGSEDETIRLWMLLYA